MSHPSRPSAVFGIDIGGTKTAVSILNPTTGRRTSVAVRELHRFATRDPRSTLDEAAEIIATDLARNAARGSPRAPTIGIACGGPLDAARGLVLSPPNLPGWDRVRVTNFLIRRFGPGTRATLMNDANANALAEWRFGAGRGCQSMVFLTAGTGMGGGIILNGRLVEGACGNAGEVGHLRLAPRGPVGFHKPGSFEGFCSGGGIAQLARFLPRADRPKNLRAWMHAHASAREIALAARGGDRTARAVFAESGRKLGAALALLIDTLNPERIVIGSLWLRCRDLLEPTMRETLAAEALPDSLRACRIVAAKLGEQIGNYGAIAAALHAESTPPRSD